MKIKKFLKYLIEMPINIFLNIFNKKPRVMSFEKTLDFIIENQISIARFGDGELSLMRNSSIRFQDKNEQLSKKLRSMETTSNCLLCIPNVFDKKYFNKSLISKEEYKFWKLHLFVRGGFWKYYFKSNNMLGDAFLSRFYIRYNDKSFVKGYIEKLKGLWDKRNVLIVEGKTSQIGVGNDILDNSKSIRRIICPNLNAYDYYDEILNAVKSHYKKDDIVLIALGPTATALAYDLSKDNIWALDMGHFDIEYEWYLAKTDKKIPVKNKHVNECGEIGVQDSANIGYLSQIVEEIGKD